MKQIPLKTVDLEFQGSKRPFSYKNELKIIFRAPMDMQRGADMEEMRKSIRVLEALDKASDVLELEDADFSYLRARVPMAKFGVVDKVIVQFIEDVTKE